MSSLKYVRAHYFVAKMMPLCLKDLRLQATEPGKRLAAVLPHYGSVSNRAASPDEVPWPCCYEKPTFRGERLVCGHICRVFHCFVREPKYLLFFAL